MTRVRFVKDPTFESQLQREAEFVAAMRSITQAVADEVRLVAPKQTGYYVRHVHARDYTVYTDDIAGHLIEWGSKNNPAYAPLRRGVRAAGLRLDEILR
jgi:hypothetical protein